MKPAGFSFIVKNNHQFLLCSIWQNEYFPPDWTPLLQVLVNRMGIGDENESRLFFNFLSTVLEAGQDKVAIHIPVVVSNIASVILREIPPMREPWPQVCSLSA